MGDRPGQMVRNPALQGGEGTGPGPNPLGMGAPRGHVDSRLFAGRRGWVFAGPSLLEVAREIASDSVRRRAVGFLVTKINFVTDQNNCHYVTSKFLDRLSL